MLMKCICNTISFVLSKYFGANFDHDKFWFLYKCYIQLYPSSYVRVGSKRYTYISHNPDTELVMNLYVNIKSSQSASNFLTGDKIKAAKANNIINSDINDRLWRLNNQRNDLVHNLDIDALSSRRRFVNDFSTAVMTLNRRRNMSAQLLTRYQYIVNMA